MFLGVTRRIATAGILTIAVGLHPGPGLHGALQRALEAVTYRGGKPTVPASLATRAALSSPASMT